MVSQQQGAGSSTYRGDLKGHGNSASTNPNKGNEGWVTSLRTAPMWGSDNDTIVISTSRDKTMMIWQYQPDQAFDDNVAGVAMRRYTGHSQPVQDLCLSGNVKYALTGSWDKTIRLWDLESGVSVRTFTGHTKDVYSVALSPDNRQILSGSRDKTIRLWNTIAECKFTLEEQGHKDWVSCVRFSPTTEQTLVVSAGWDKVLKVWDLVDFKLKSNLVGHTAAVHTLTIAPDGSLCASGGKDGVAMLWDVNDGKHLYSLPADSPINTLCFSPCHYWLTGATDRGVVVWSLEHKVPLFEIARPESRGKKANKSSYLPWCTALSWSADGRTLFTGHCDGTISAHELRTAEY